MAAKVALIKQEFYTDIEIEGILGHTTQVEINSDNIILC